MGLLDGKKGLIIGMANSAALQYFHSVLDGSGTATATLNTGGPLPPSTVGLVMYFAYLLYYPVTFSICLYL